MTFPMRAKAVCALAAGAVVLAGCGGGGGDSADESPDTAIETTTAEGLTAPGVALGLGEPATVEFVPNAPNPKPTSKIAVTVTSVKAGKIKDLAQFTLPDRAKTASVYYVDATVENLGDGNLDGTWLVLYGKASASLVVPPVKFGSTYAPCNYQPFGKSFTKGAKSKVCMVILVPDKGMITEVQWRSPDDEKPISWPAS